MAKRKWAIKTEIYENKYYVSDGRRYAITVVSRFIFISIYDIKVQIIAINCWNVAFERVDNTMVKYNWSVRNFSFSPHGSIILTSWGCNPRSRILLQYFVSNAASFLKGQVTHWQCRISGSSGLYVSTVFRSRITDRQSQIFWSQRRPAAVLAKRCDKIPIGGDLYSEVWNSNEDLCICYNLRKKCNIERVFHFSTFSTFQRLYLTIYIYTI